MMSAAPNDPTRTTVDSIAADLLEHGVSRDWFGRLSDAGQEKKLAEWLIECGAGDIIEQLDNAQAELLRLNGPVCPFDQKRASEHRLVQFKPHANVRFDVDAHQIIGERRDPHPPAPEIEAWLAGRRS